jgi:GPH family glycoside/pentoside/hexuronide:cation symporter
MVGELAGFALTPLVYTRYGFVAMAACLACVAVVLGFASLATIKEDPSVQLAPRVAMRPALAELVRDGPYWRFTLVVTLLWFATGIYTVATPFYTKYTLDAGPRSPSLIFATVFLVAIASAPLWARRARDRGRHGTWMLAIGTMGVSSIMLALAPSLAAAVAGAALAGLGLGGIKVCRELILARLVDRARSRLGKRNEGLYYGMNRFVGHLSKLLEAAAFVLLGIMFGYVSGQSPGPDPGAAFRFLMGVVPAVSVVVAFLSARSLGAESGD